MDDTILIDLEEVCRILSISGATGRNWVKSGRITPVENIGGKHLFAKEEIEILLAHIIAGRDSRLKSRRNKKHITGSFVVPANYIESRQGIEAVQNILAHLDGFTLPEGYERLILAEYAIKLLADRGLIQPSPDYPATLDQYLHEPSFAGCYSPLLADVVGDISRARKVLPQIAPALTCRVEYRHGEDLLGLLFMSLTCIGERKSKGVYYTPCKVVKETVASLATSGALHPSKRTVDPCCGTGNFLIHAFNVTEDLHCLYGWDKDELSIALARLNMVLASKTTDVALLLKNFTCRDSLLSEENRHYDLVLGNPPWGYEFTAAEDHTLRTRYASATTKTLESFSVFLEYALRIVVEGGHVSFVLPEAFLHVGIHQPIRDIILSCGTVTRVRYWGNVFSGVHCPSITLTLQKKSGAFSMQGTEVVTDTRVFTINECREIERKNWSFNISDNEAKLLKKIDTHVPTVTLKSHADFALGIVTGNNKKFILPTPVPGAEIVLKGNDIFKYRVRPSNHYIVFQPDVFQQVAPAELYRSEEKLLYRFICNTLVFAYDNAKTLSLNSANIVIPRLDGFSAKYILAILNSRTIQYYFQLKFSSVKILRAHIEALPIPAVDAGTQNIIATLVDQLLESPGKIQSKHLYEQIEAEVMKAFDLTAAERQEICETTAKLNLFLP